MTAHASELQQRQQVQRHENDRCCRRIGAKVNGEAQEAAHGSGPEKNAGPNGTCGNPKERQQFLGLDADARHGLDLHFLKHEAAIPASTVGQLRPTLDPSLGAQLLTGNLALGLDLDGDRKLGAAGLMPVCHVLEVAETGVAPAREGFPSRSVGQRLEVRLELHEARIHHLVYGRQHLQV